MSQCSWPEALLTICPWSFSLIQVMVLVPLETFCFSLKELPRFGLHLFLAWKVHEEPLDVLLTCSRVNFLKYFLA